LPATSASKVEACASWETASTSREATSATETASAESTLVTHHAEQNLGVDATHAAAHAATAAEHIRWVNEIIAIVVTGFLPE
jgi:hypothetical protein